MYKNIPFKKRALNNFQIHEHGEIIINFVTVTLVRKKSSETYASTVHSDYLAHCNTVLRHSMVSCCTSLLSVALRDVPLSSNYLLSLFDRAVF